MNQATRVPIWVGVGVSVVSLVVVFQRADLSQVASILVQVDQNNMAMAAALQLAVTVVLGVRWRLLFRVPPRLAGLVKALFVAQLANAAMPLRLGMIVRAYLVSHSEERSKVTILATIGAEKVFDALASLLICVIALSVFAPEWLQWSTIGPRGLMVVVCMMAVVLVTRKRHQLLRLATQLIKRYSWFRRLNLRQRFEDSLEGLVGLQKLRTFALLCCWSVAIVVMGVVVNYLIMRALHIDASMLAAILLFAALQIGNKLLPAAPLGGIGVFQFICMEALALFGVSREQGLSYGLLLQFVVLVPGSILGVIALYRMRSSLRQLEEEAGKQRD